MLFHLCMVFEALSAFHQPTTHPCDCCPPLSALSWSSYGPLAAVGPTEGHGDWALE
jgi:hypothetical protein